jgi:hypothetical protein
VGKDGKVMKETERVISCDCLLLSVGLIPENELSLEAGILLDPHSRGPVVDEYLQTSVEGVFAAGNVLQVWDLVDYVTLEGGKAGRNAARYVSQGLKKASRPMEVVAGENVRTVTPHRVVGTGQVEFALRVKEPLQDAEVKIGGVRKKFKVLSPTEVIQLTLEPSDLAGVRRAGAIEVSCSERKSRRSL